MVFETNVKKAYINGQLQRPLGFLGNVITKYGKTTKGACMKGVSDVFGVFSLGTNDSNVT